MSRDPRESARELRGIAALIVTGESPQLVGPCTLVTNGTTTIAFSSSELLRAAPEPLAIALTLDCKKTFPVTAWHLTRTPHLGVIELGAEFPSDPALDVEPLPMAAVCATIDTRGAPSALVTMQSTETGVERRVIPVHVDALDSDGVSDDVITRLASPDAPADVDVPIDGAPLISWLPADPLLGRPAEVAVVALGCTYAEKTHKPREQPAMAELWALHDLGRVLPWQSREHADLAQVAGEWDVSTGPVVGDIEGD